ncbi:DUF4258 domain-containing protein [Candidatus Woesearchaeota archaeon]|nr:DUF4258 domain-containing protein [Candidatus Woesearchaeota archaeon]
MELQYTAHCEEQIAERKLEKVWVEETIRYPDKTERTGKKYYVTKKLNGGTLRVVYIKEKYIKVITAYWL